jgi:hypothetical protein
MKFTNPQAENFYHILRESYKNQLVLNKKQLAEVRGCSTSTINLEVSKGIGVPFIKMGTAKNSSVRFNIIDVAEYLSQTVKTA